LAGERSRGTVVLLTVVMVIVLGMILVRLAVGPTARGPGRESPPTATGHGAVQSQYPPPG
jgi:hypothetical protein